METLPTSQESIELCTRAILIYREAELVFRGREDNDKRKMARENEAFNGARALSSQPFGLRLGAPGWPDAKLIYWYRNPNPEKLFWVDGNGMDEETYHKWQSFVGERFKANGFPFFEFPKKK